MADEVESLFGRRPVGAWLAERVWEPDVPTSLAKAGYAYTIVDDAHFRAAAIPAERHWGSYSTDDQGYRVIVYGSEQGLRYRIPFRPVEEVIDYLREHATEDGGLVGMMGDDGEKFGTWPGTWELCHGKGQWVERFFSALEENSRLADAAAAGGGAACSTRPSAASTCPPGPTPRWASGRCPWRRGASSRTCSTRPWSRASRRRAGCAAASGAASRSTTARSTTSTSRCCGSHARWTPCATAAAEPSASVRPAGGRRSSWPASPTTSTRASRTTATGTGSSAASTSRTCAWPRSSTSSRPRMRPTGQPGQRRHASRPWTSTSTATTSCW